MSKAILPGISVTVKPIQRMHTNVNDSFEKPGRSGRKLTGIEAGRGIAAIMVVLYHAARHIKADYGAMPWSGAAQFGHAGVDFFFVLSGFIIFYVHRQDFSRPAALAGYFERRFIRIYPLFWVSLAVGTILTLLSSKPMLLSAGELLQRMTLLPFGGDVGVAWTLQHEIIFYLIFALAVINRVLGIAAFFAWFCIITVAALNAYVPVDSPVLTRLVSVFNIQFFFGMFAAYVVRAGILKKYSVIAAAGTLMFFSIAAAENFSIFDGYSNQAKIAYGLSAMLIVIGLAGANLAGHLNAPKFFTALGKASYSIYLLHIPSIGVIYKLLEVAGIRKFIPPDLLYFLLSVGSIIICMIVSKYIEYPLMNLFKRGTGSLRMTPRFKAATEYQEGRAIK
ncbi:MAG: acyltransferase [Massilia sp.]|nr:MAG: acyltransferase [Massilia sp.]